MSNLLTSDVSISVLSNIIFEPYFISCLRSCFGKVNVHHIPYGEHNKSVYKEKFAASNLIIVWLNVEGLLPDMLNGLQFPTTDKIIRLCDQICTDLVVETHAHILWFLFEDYFTPAPTVMGHIPQFFIDEVNLKLTDFFRNKVTLVDLKHLIAKVGIINAYDSKGKYRWNTPYSKALIEAAVKEIYKQYLIEKAITKKCLVLDCDNVLWGGILLEDGIENLKLGGSGLGRVYQDFHRFVLSLYRLGVILAVCSKNDLSDVMLMFHEHSEMILKEEHIACFQVNWLNKPENIKKISETLNIELDSIVFVDDLPIEIEAVKTMLPEVTTILFERDMVYEQFTCFNLKNNVNKTDIEKRNETYRTNQSREVLKSQYKSNPEYIYALEIKMDIHEALPIEYSRISELTQRTNKCTNGVRYTIAGIKERMASENVTLYSISVSDRFCDLGLVGALEIENGTLTLFSLSCRAFGREIESKMLEFISGKHQIITIDFKSTGKNNDVKELLLKAFPNVTLTNCEDI